MLCADVMLLARVQPETK